jgi:hypothetical protein
MQTNKIVIFVTHNNKLFGNVQSALTGVILQREKGIREVKKTRKNLEISSLIVHVTNPNSWGVFELLQKECSAIPCYAILAPSVLKKSDDLVNWAKTKNATGVFRENDIKALAGEVEKTLPFVKQDIPLDDLYADNFVRLNFIQLMKQELLANQNKGKKGDWREWQPDELFMVAEINWHVAKLVQALHQGDAAKVSEYSADVANYMMKADELFGKKQK